MRLEAEPGVTRSKVSRTARTGSLLVIDASSQTGLQTGSPRTCLISYQALKKIKR